VSSISIAGPTMRPSSLRYDRAALAQLPQKDRLVRGRGNPHGFARIEEGAGIDMAAAPG